MAMSGRRHLTGINWLGGRVSSLLVEFSFLVSDVDKHDLFVLYHDSKAISQAIQTLGHNCFKQIVLMDIIL